MTIHSRSLCVLFGMFAMVCCRTATASEPFFTEQSILIDDDEWDYENFGRSVAVEGEYVLVGARRDRPNDVRCGSVFVYDRTTHELLYSVEPLVQRINIYFGESLAVGDGIFVVGAPFHDGIGNRSGIAYVYELATGQLLSVLEPSQVQPEDRFGQSIAVNDGLIVVGAHGDDMAGNDNGAVYVFDSGTLELIRALRPETNDLEINMGCSVATDNGVVVTGACHDSQGEEWAGAVYVFDGVTGDQLQKITPDDPTYRGSFGNSVAIENQWVIVGKIKDSSGSVSIGAAYVFDYLTGQQMFKLLPGESEEIDSFGADVAINNSIVAVGAPDEGTGSNYRVHLFRVETGREFARLKPEEHNRSDKFGWTVDLDDRQVIVGDFSYYYHPPTVGGRDQDGAAFLYDLPCEADLTYDRVLDIFDFYLFFGAFVQNDFLADFDANGSLDVFDVFEYLDRYNAGC